MLKITLPPQTPAFLIQSDAEGEKLGFPTSLAPFDSESEILLPRRGHSGDHQDSWPQNLHKQRYRKESAAKDCICYHRRI